MRNLKLMLVLLMVMAMLLSASGIAEEQEGTELELLPVENAEVPADVPVDEPLLEGEDTATVKPATFTLDQSSATLDYSQSVILTATTGGDEVSWSSNDESVATLSATNGEIVNVVAVSEGTAIITCTLGEETQTCEVTVKAPETLQITGVDYPSTFQNTRRGWKLRNGTVASVDDLAELTSEIKNANGELIGNSYTQTFSEGEKRYDIKGIDRYVPFSRMTKEGQYTWTLTATEVSGRMVSMSLPINATASEETAVASEPGVYSSPLPATENMETTSDSADELPATGRNLILNSGFEGMTDAGIYTFNGDEVTFHAADFGGEGNSFYLNLSEYGLQNACGKTLLLSMEYRIDEALEFGPTNPWVGFELGLLRDETIGAGNQWLAWYGPTNIPTAVTGDWVRYSCIAKVSDYDILSNSSIGIYFRDTKGTISFRHPMIEIINTDWSSAPEDMISVD